jgi:hypothetical protein
LIQNGSFELPVVDTLTNYSAGSNAIPNWVVYLNSVTLIPDTYVDGATYPAKDGKQSLDLTGPNIANGGVEQTVATLLGQQYLLSFWTADFYYLENVARTKLFINGAEAGTYVNDESETVGGTAQVWKQFQHNFVATSASTTIRFASDNAPGGIYLSGLDDVSLIAGSSAVPEPGTIALAAMGIGGLLILRRKH